MNSRSKALFISKLAQDKKAEDIAILDMRKISNMTDFFVILSGNSTRQVKAITDHVIETLKSFGHKKRHVEGYRYALWVLLDYGDVWVHVFCADTRKFYGLERLWSDAPVLRIREQ